MKNIIKFLNANEKELQNLEIFKQFKCSLEEAKILQYITKQYVNGFSNLVVVDILSEFYDTKNFTHLEKLPLIKNLLKLGWISEVNLIQNKLVEATSLELLNASISLTPAFLKLLEVGNLDLILPEIKPYNDHLEYLKDQFFRIDIVSQLNNVKNVVGDDAPNIARLKSKLTLLENRINERLKITKHKITIEELFKEHNLSEKEKLIFLAILKEEYSGENESIRDMNYLISLISNDEYEKIKNRSLLEENSKLVSAGLIDYDEILTPFGGINRNFFIPDNILYKVSHPTSKTKRKQKIKLENLIKEQDLFELIEPKVSLEDIVLAPKTKEVIDNLLSQVDKNVINRLKEWGIKDKKSGISAKIIFYGSPGTGKTITSHAIAKNLKKPLLSFDCSKILSMYVGESEKNVRKIFDSYYEIAKKSKTEPILLLNEADQFLSSRISGEISGSEKMHNQMQNIFLEQIEKFDGILIATTNFLENLDKAFSRRFNYKIKFEKPNEEQRLKLWEKLLPKNLPLEDSFDIKKLAKFPLTGGQIDLIIKNTAYKVATKSNPIFSTKDFIDEIEKEQSSMFDKEIKTGFLS